MEKEISANNKPDHDDTDLSLEVQVQTLKFPSMLFPTAFKTLLRAKIKKNCNHSRAC